MIKLSKACIICQATESLNTNTTIKISENEQYSVSVCSTCEESASPKMMRSSLVAILDRANGVCLELTKYLGYEVTLISICNPSVPPMELPETEEVEDSAEAEQAPAAQPKQQSKQQQPAISRQSKQQNNLMLNKPINRDQRRGGGAPATAPQFRNQKVLNKIKDPTGKPIDLPKDVIVVQNEGKIESKSSNNFDDASYKDGYRQCHVCNGEGGIFSEDKMKVCTTCGGSGLMARML